MTKRFYIDIEVPPFNGKLSIDIDAGSEKQAWENVHRMLGRKVYQLKTTHTVDLPGESDNLIERGSVSLAKIAHEALLQCNLYGHDVNALANAVDTEILAMLENTEEVTTTDDRLVLLSPEVITGQGESDD